MPGELWSPVITEPQQLFMALALPFVVVVRLVTFIELGLKGDLSPL